MFAKITVEEALNKDNKIFIDVRSPLEYEEGTIPGAINIPILDNDERAVVGVTYKKQSSEEAKIKGVEYASAKLSHIYNEISLLAKQYRNIIIFCWRGGLRSATVSNFVSSLGINAFQLEGGYKQYRRHVLEYFDKEKFKHSFIVLHGYTGVGKTEILERLQKSNIPTLNLEQLARNSGSVFGTIGYQKEEPVTQKMFDALAFETLRSSNSRYIVIESEGSRLGGITLLEGLFEAILKGQQVLINTSIENRVERLVDDYVNKVPNSANLLKQSILNLKKRIGLEKVSKYISFIEESKYDIIARELIIEYYDPLYIHSINKYNYMMEINYEHIEEALDQIIKLYDVLENESN